MENARISSTLCLTVLLLINPLSISQGTLKNGKVVAVKKLALGQSNRVKADFASEVTLISNVHHRNLIRLLGRCTKGPELLLVYEYMANSSLDRFLFGNVNRLWCHFKIVTIFFKTEISAESLLGSRWKTRIPQMEATIWYNPRHSSRARLSARAIPCVHHSSRYKIQQHSPGWRFPTQDSRFWVGKASTWKSEPP